jgi:hypothetical protein
MANSSKSWTISDTDLQFLLDWAAIQFQGYIQQTFGTTTPTNQQILLAWLQVRLINSTISDVQSFHRTTPPPITIS